jgi:hypothetical protein
MTVLRSSAAMMNGQMSPAMSVTYTHEGAFEVNLI